MGRIFLYAQSRNDHFAFLWPISPPIKKGIKIIRHRIKIKYNNIGTSPGCNCVGGMNSWITRRLDLQSYINCLSRRSIRFQFEIHSLKVLATLGAIQSDINDSYIIRPVDGFLLLRTILRLTASSIYTVCAVLLR